MKKGFIAELALVLVAVALAGVVYVNNKAQPQTFGTTLPINGSTYILAGSGVTSSATSFTLTSLTIPQNGYEITDADASDTFYMTIEPGSRTRQEVVSCTTITQNANNTATISGCNRGLSPISPYTASTTLKFAHSGGSQVIFGDAAQLFNEYTAKANDEGISGTWTFADSPLLTTDCTVASANDEICAKAYIDGVSIAGASNSNETTKGIVELATQIEMASSTQTGSTAANLSLWAKYATSSPYTTGLWLPVTQNDGKLSQSFTRLSDSYTWTGVHTFSKTMVGAVQTLTDVATTTIDWSAGNTAYQVLGAAGREIMFSNVTSGTALRLFLCQDGTGNRTVTYWPASVRWATGFAPTLSTGANKCDIISLITATSTTSVFGAATTNF